MATAKIKIEADLFQRPIGRELMKLFGGDGIAFYLYLLCVLRKEGYYITVGGDFTFLAAADLQVAVNKIDRMLAMMVRHQLFDAAQYQTHRVLTSEEIQREYRQRTKQSGVPPYWLIGDAPIAREVAGEIPEHFSPALYEKVAEWLAYKRERGKGYKAAGLRALIGEIERRRLQYGDEKICGLIDLCMGNNWQGIIWERLEQRQNPKKQLAQTAGSSIDKEKLNRMIHGQFGG